VLLELFREKKGEKGISGAFQKENERRFMLK
jgi:hypothetical protein